ncbi:MAG: tRNA uridine-5-carboxymethylaminomethyl(34) synthesis enzyme MnmG [Candidatus Eremiobacteraeota bacterium]|nr:tRNA uridine-5-carboxymethylaminomethyl(34) synthesis enzyme MnmG [Candidatus Eremiobacteraeota bacterium]
MKSKTYDVIVIGGGHAGIEAALVASRMCCNTVLISMNLDTLGQMSCNPAIGGVAKGHLVKEIDALGGEMGRAADACGLQFRRLNSSKGPAVRSSRAQCDRMLYQAYMKHVLENQDNLELLQGTAVEILQSSGEVQGIRLLTGDVVFGHTAIIAPGTFLNGLLHIGLRSFPGGRMGDFPSNELAESIRKLGFETGRFKTGTCARLDARTIDFTRLKIQPGDKEPIPFSADTDSFPEPQLPCYITYTNPETHKIIRENLDRSPLYSGKITGRGVRYCPSIEDKIVKFAERDHHQIFLEPEGRNTNEIYPNGISTSLPIDVQEAFIHTIEGLESARIMRPGYGIEHDYCDPTQLYPTLETKIIKNLYFAGQINGTTGYEEAGAQGLIAGINAALKTRGKPPFVLGRDQAYIGVLIDDLVTRGTDEPYRMFTSRAEYRLVLREDNADLRLSQAGYEIGLLSQERYEKFSKKRATLASEMKRLKNTRITPSDEINMILEELGTSRLHSGISLEELLRRPEFSYNDIPRLLPGWEPAPKNIAEQVEIQIQYSGFLDRQEEEIRKSREMEELPIPPDTDYENIASLSREIRDKLSRIRPMTLGQASRIPGITPAAISALLIHCKRRK